MIEYYEKTIKNIKHSLSSIDKKTFLALVDQSKSVLENGNKIIVSGLGKNVPICDKFVGSMLSLGLDANFLHTNSAIHGDLGMVRSGDLVIILSKSGNTAESIYLAKQLQQRDNINVWLLTFNKNNAITDILGIDKTLSVDLLDEGDPWNIMPNNSTTINLIILQSLVMELAEKMELSLEDFKVNHPGGAIGEQLKNV